jgi:hypothetical protein
MHERSYKKECSTSTATSFHRHACCFSLVAPLPCFAWVSCPLYLYSRCPRFCIQRHGIGHQVIDTPHGFAAKSRSAVDPHTAWPTCHPHRASATSKQPQVPRVRREALLAGRATRHSFPSRSNYPPAPRVGRVLRLSTPPSHTLHTE